MATGDAHYGVCVECEEPIRDVSKRATVSERPPDPRDRDDHGEINVAHEGCL